MPSSAEHTLLLQHVHASPDALDGVDIVNPLLANVITLFSDAQLLARLSKSRLDRQQLGVGDAIVVNGQLAPTLTLPPMQWTRLRLVHATMSFNLALRAQGCELQLIANDGVYLSGGAPAPLREITMLPGSRRDVLIRCARAGTYALRTARETLMSAGPAPVLFPPAGDDVDLLVIVVAGQPAPNAAPTRLPRLPSYLPDLRNSSVDGRFDVRFHAGVGTAISASDAPVVALAALVLLLAFFVWKMGWIGRVPSLRALVGGWCLGTPPPTTSDGGSLLLPAAALRSDEAADANSGAPTAAGAAASADGAMGTASAARARDLEEERAIRESAAQPKLAPQRAAPMSVVVMMSRLVACIDAASDTIDDWVPDVCDWGAAKPKPRCPCCHWLFCMACALTSIATLATVLTSLTSNDSVNGLVFAPHHGSQHTMRLGAVEEWSVTNGDPLVPHPFHMHVNHVQLTAAPAGNTFGFRLGDYYDTITMPLASAGGGDFKVRFRPADFVGEANVVVHCHILAHEDGGMMLLTSILP